MFRRRVKKGQCWRRPYLGTREFAAEFTDVDDGDAPICETIPIGSMLFDVFYNEQGACEPVFFYDVAVINGVLNCEVPENDKMMMSSHLRPQQDSIVSSAVYDFNISEEREVDQ